MSDETRSGEIESPCIKLCMIHPEAGICAGCFRTIDEIAAWSRLEPEARRRIMAELPARKGRLATRRGGRTARLARAGNGGAVTGGSHD